MSPRDPRPPRVSMATRTDPLSRCCPRVICTRRFLSPGGAALRYGPRPAHPTAPRRRLGRGSVFVSPKFVIPAGSVSFTIWRWPCLASRGSKVFRRSTRCYPTPALRGIHSWWPISFESRFGFRISLKLGGSVPVSLDRRGSGVTPKSSWECRNLPVPGYPPRRF